MTIDRALAMAASVLGALALVAGDTLGPGGPGEVSALELAGELRSHAAELRILDIRSDSAYADFHVPRAVQVPIERQGVDLEAWLTDVMRVASPAAPVVVAGGPGTDPRPAWLALRKAGFANVRYMSDAVGDWVDSIVSPVLPASASPSRRAIWEDQAELARYFGGFPRIATDTESLSRGTAERLRRARRRGCAF